MRRISDKGLDLIKQFEGLRLAAYVCPAGVVTIGYGHTNPYLQLGTRITLVEAERLLKQDVERFERAVNRLVKVPITQGIFDSLVSFAFNLGEGALERSTLLRLLNQGQYAKAGDQLLVWNKANGQSLAGLVRRRNAERRLWYSQPFPNVPRSS